MPPNLNSIHGKNIPRISFLRLDTGAELLTSGRITIMLPNWMYYSNCCQDTQRTPQAWADILAGPVEQSRLYLMPIVRNVYLKHEKTPEILGTSQYLWGFLEHNELNHRGPASYADSEDSVTHYTKNMPPYRINYKGAY